MIRKLYNLFFMNSSTRILKHFFLFQPPDFEYNPIPYSFNYKSDTEDGGSSSHEESGDGSGTVRGSYTVNNLEGHIRVVEYEAGPNGFTAVVRTNEPGTDNSFPANVIFESTAPEAKGPVIRYGNDQSTRFSAREPASYNPPSPNAVSGGRGQNTRYVLVPSTDPRAAGRS